MISDITYCPACRVQAYEQHAYGWVCTECWYSNPEIKISAGEINSEAQVFPGSTWEFENESA